jgi:hypothetical protein
MLITVAADARDDGDVTAGTSPLAEGQREAENLPEGSAARPRLRVRTVERTALVRFADAEFLFEESAVRAVGEQLDRLITEGGQTRLVLNFRGVRYMSSDLLAALAGLQKRVGPGGAASSFAGWTCRYGRWCASRGWTGSSTSAPTRWRRWACWSLDAPGIATSQRSPHRAVVAEKRVIDGWRRLRARPVGGAAGPPEPFPGVPGAVPSRRVFTPAPGCWPAVAGGLSEENVTFDGRSC